MERTHIRRTVRQKRRTLSPAERQHMAERMACHLAGDALFMRAERIAAYLAVDGEMDCGPLLARAWERGKQVYLPVLVPHGVNRLWFLPFDPDQPMLYNRFRIPEPALHARHRISPMALDLVLTPLVAFGDAGARLGMGGGYYDRTFAYLHHRRLWRTPHLIGVAYSFQYHPGLEAGSWDVPLSAVVTEEGIRWFGR